MRIERRRVCTGLKIPCTRKGKRLWENFRCTAVCRAPYFFCWNFRKSREIFLGGRRPALPRIMGVPGSEIGPISGTAGLSFVFTELGKATGERKYLDFAATETEKIASLAKRIGEGVEWLGEPGGISYDAGIALYLLYEAKAFQREDCGKAPA